MTDDKESSADSASLRDALDNSQSLLVMIDHVGPDSASWIKEDMRDLLTKQIVENRTSLSDPKRAEPQAAPLREEIATVLADNLWCGATFADALPNEKEAFLSAADATIHLLGRCQAVSAPFDLADAINAGIKACDLYEVAKEDVLRRSHLEQFLTAAMAALTRPERKP